MGWTLHIGYVTLRQAPDALNAAYDEAVSSGQLVNAQEATQARLGVQTAIALILGNVLSERPEQAITITLAGRANEGHSFQANALESCSISMRQVTFPAGIPDELMEQRPPEDDEKKDPEPELTPQQRAAATRAANKAAAEADGGKHGDSN